MFQLIMTYKNKFNLSEFANFWPEFTKFVIPGGKWFFEKF
jgi:hypothetical protein